MTKTTVSAEVRIGDTCSVIVVQRVPHPVQEVAVHRDCLPSPALPDLPASEAVVRCTHMALSCSIAYPSDWTQLALLPGHSLDT